MANRRMTSLDVIDTDAFLEMPVSSQLLYFHLNARADDDGFVSNPKKLARLIGPGDDDLKVLIAKKFIISFEDGVVVIKHWRINNFIRKDRYQETKYLDHKQALYIRGNGAYTLTEDGRSTPVPLGHFSQELVDQRLTSGQRSIGKYRLGKDSKDQQPEPQAALISELIHSFEGMNPNASTLYGRPPQRRASAFLIEHYGLDRAKKAVEFVEANRDDRFCPSITTPVQLKEKWAQLEDYGRKKKGRVKQVIL